MRKSIRTTALILVLVMAFALTASGSGDTIRMVAPQLGFNDDQIAAREAAGEIDNPFNQYYIGVRDALGAEYPEYDIEYVDWGWAETLDQKQRSLIAAGDAPDLIAGEIFIPTYASEGILEPLPDDIVDMSNPSFLVYDNDGRAVAVAHKASIFMLFYNKDILSAAGLDPDKPPTTWDEWKSMSDQITAAGNGEFWGGGVPSFPHAGGALRATPFFRQNGTDFYKDGKVNLDDPKLQETLSFIREMNRNLPAGLGNGADEGPLWDAFQKTKNIGFVVDGSWQASGSARNNVNWGVAPLPLPEGGVEGNCLVGAVYHGVPKTAANKEASFNLIRTALREDLQKIWIDETVCVPLNSIINNTSLYEHNETLMVAMNALKGGQYSGLASFPKNDSQVWEIINQKLLARTTMTEDDIAAICGDALREIEPLIQ